MPPSIPGANSGIEELDEYHAHCLSAGGQFVASFSMHICSAILRVTMKYSNKPFISHLCRIFQLGLAVYPDH